MELYTVHHRLVLQGIPGGFYSKLEGEVSLFIGTDTALVGWYVFKNWEVAMNSFYHKFTILSASHSKGGGGGGVPSLGLTLSVHGMTEQSKRIHTSVVKSQGPLRGFHICGCFYKPLEEVTCLGTFFTRDSYPRWVVQTLPWCLPTIYDYVS